LLVFESTPSPEQGLVIGKSRESEFLRAHLFDEAEKVGHPFFGSVLENQN